MGTNGRRKETKEPSALGSMTSGEHAGQPVREPEKKWPPELQERCIRPHLPACAHLLLDAST